jgi:predicted metalloprotease
MRWEDGRRSDNIEDQRGQRRRMAGFPVPQSRGGKLGGGGILGLLIVFGIAMLLGVDPRQLLGSGMVGAPASVEAPAAPPEQSSPGEERLKDFISVVLADTEDTWGMLFSGAGATYEQPKLVLFRDAVQSACGFAQSAAGPFYCPGDRKVYLDMRFFAELERRFGAPGDFAIAYVVAHEVGHHVQTLLGISQQVRQQQARSSEREANALLVRLELQADCFAGLWAHHAQRSRQVLEQGDIEEALGAAHAVGDDTIQRQTTGTVVPDAFTHGSAEQRKRWFMTGFESGTVEACDTFRARQL